MTDPVRSEEAPLEVLALQSLARPGVGRAPARVASRPFLPQHARVCPVLEAASALGYLVYPALNVDEACQIAYDADGSYQFEYLRQGNAGDWQRIFTMTFTPPAGGVGLFRQEFACEQDALPFTEAEIAEVRDAVVNVANFGLPAGAVALRAATDFRTPTGWDAVFTGVLNHIQPPVIPVLSVRVETDWYAHDTEFRYVLAPGDILFVTATLPIGQVFFVPRTDPGLRVASPAEEAEFRASAALFSAQKRALHATTPFGLQYSSAYTEERAQRRR